MSKELDAIQALYANYADKAVMLSASSIAVLFYGLERIKPLYAWKDGATDDISQADQDEIERIVDLAFYEIMQEYICPDMNIIGEIRTFPYAPPSGWHDCNGDSLSKVDYAALYAVIGDTFGNADSDHFFIPDLRGKFAMGAVLGGTPYGLAATGGLAEVTLTVDQIPAHTHQNGRGNAGSAKSSWTAANVTNYISYQTSESTGGDQPHENLPPYVALVQAIYTGV